MFEIFPDEESCLAHIFAKRFGKDLECYRCSKRGGWRHNDGERFYWHSCGAIVSPTSGTFLSRTRIPLVLWFYSLLHFANSAQSVSSPFLARQLGVSEPTAYRMGAMIRLHLAAIDANEKIGGKDQDVIVRTYMIRRAITPSRNTANKARILVFSDSRKVCSTVLIRPKYSDISGVVGRRLALGSRLLTDDHETFRLLSWYGACRPLAHFSPTYFLDRPRVDDGVHGFMSYFWNSFGDQFRGVSCEYLWRYLKEYEFRYNRRDTSAQIFWDSVAEFPRLTRRVQRDLALEFMVTNPRRSEI